jgi:hypothetical protein
VDADKMACLIISQFEALYKALKKGDQPDT